MSEPLLQVRGLTKRFGGITALDGVDFDLRPGEVHSLCGENGAGKSTLIKLLSGVYGAGSYEGKILLKGKETHFLNTKDAEAHGIGVIHQELALVPEMTVAENLLLGNEPTRFGLIDWHQVHERAASILKDAQIDLDPSQKISELGVGRQQLCEIAKAIGKKSRILILDEPTAALTDQEVEALLALVKRQKKEGISLIYISHKLDEVFAISDRITVLRDGHSIVTLDAAKTNEGDVIRHMVGRKIEDLFPRRETKPKEPLLQVSALCVAPAAGKKDSLKDISFEVRAGEVLGIGGLMGAGRTELLMHIFGAWGVRSAGTVTLDGKDLGEIPPHETLKRGLALVSEDRKRFGLNLDQSIGRQLTLSSLDSFKKGLLLDEARLHSESQKLFDSLRIKAQDLETIVGNLSGGNQQKVVLGKALLTEPKVLFLDEPTRGIDVGAKLEVYELVNQLTEQGKAVVLVSSELPELLGMSDRILMLCEGRATGLFDRSEATEEVLLTAALGKSAVGKSATSKPASAEASA